MNEIIQYILMLTTGFVLGMLFFGGLWFTVKKSVSAKNPVVWIVGSFIVRMGSVLLGFYYMAQFGWRAMFLGLLGLIMARIITMYFIKKYDAKQHLSK
ncbi:MAG: ATP synthase subunit I [Lutibacter sp.]|nr:ATP synthase subunit I [Lutibacter sp.]MDT8417772.1 ATP synthase subunit I [Lutibacter sp.]